MRVVFVCALVLLAALVCQHAAAVKSKRSRTFLQHQLQARNKAAVAVQTEEKATLGLDPILLSVSLGLHLLTAVVDHADKAVKVHYINKMNNPIKVINATKAKSKAFMALSDHIFELTKKEDKARKELHDHVKTIASLEAKTELDATEAEIEVLRTLITEHVKSNIGFTFDTKTSKMSTGHDDAGAAVRTAVSDTQSLLQSLAKSKTQGGAVAHILAHHPTMLAISQHASPVFGVVTAAIGLGSSIVTLISDIKNCQKYDALYQEYATVFLKDVDYVFCQTYSELIKALNTDLSDRQKTFEAIPASTKTDNLKKYWDAFLAPLKDALQRVSNHFHDECKVYTEVPASGLQPIREIWQGNPFWPDKGTDVFRLDLEVKNQPSWFKTREVAHYTALEFYRPTKENADAFHKANPGTSESAITQGTYLWSPLTRMTQQVFSRDNLLFYDNREHVVYDTGETTNPGPFYNDPAEPILNERFWSRLRDARVSLKHKCGAFKGHASQELTRACEYVRRVDWLSNSERRKFREGGNGIYFANFCGAKEYRCVVQAVRELCCSGCACPRPPVLTINYNRNPGAPIVDLATAEDVAREAERVKTELEALAKSQKAPTQQQGTSSATCPVTADEAGPIVKPNDQADAVVKPSKYSDPSWNIVMPIVNKDTKDGCPNIRAELFYRKDWHIDVPAGILPKK